MKEVVIKIPDLVYESIIVGAETSRDEADVLFAIRQGTVLPKGHGRLIDAEWALNLYKPTNVSDETWAETTLAKAINNTPTIVPADKESKE